MMKQLIFASVILINSIMASDITHETASLATSPAQETFMPRYAPVNFTRLKRLLHHNVSLFETTEGCNAKFLSHLLHTNVLSKAEIANFYPYQRISSCGKTIRELHSLIDNLTVDNIWDLLFKLIEDRTKDRSSCLHDFYKFRNVVGIIPDLFCATESAYPMMIFYLYNFANMHDLFKKAHAEKTISVKKWRMLTSTPFLSISPRNPTLPWVELAEIQFAHHQWSIQEITFEQYISKLSQYEMSYYLYYITPIAQQSLTMYGLGMKPKRILVKLTMEKYNSIVYGLGAHRVFFKKIINHPDKLDITSLPKPQLLRIQFNEEETAPYSLASLALKLFAGVYLPANPYQQCFTRAILSPEGKSWCALVSQVDRIATQLTHSNIESLSYLHTIYIFCPNNIFRIQNGVVTSRYAAHGVTPGAASEFWPTRAQIPTWSYSDDDTDASSDEPIEAEASESTPDDDTDASSDEPTEAEASESTPDDDTDASSDEPTETEASEPTPSEPTSILRTSITALRPTQSTGARAALSPQVRQHFRSISANPLDIRSRSIPIDPYGQRKKRASKKRIGALSAGARVDTESSASTPTIHAITVAIPKLLRFKDALDLWKRLKGEYKHGTKHVHLQWKNQEGKLLMLGTFSGGHGRQAQTVSQGGRSGFIKSLRQLIPLVYPGATITIKYTSDSSISLYTEERI